MSTVEEHIARLQAMKPKEGGWLTREFQEGAAIFCGAHLDEIEAAWTATQQPAERERTWWFLENHDGEWLENESHGDFTRDPNKALKWPNAQAADQARNQMRMSLWAALKSAPTAHRWVSPATQQPVSEGWRPIETAPKDGSRFLAWGGGLDDEIETCSWSAGTGCWNLETYTADDRDDEPEGYCRPTHWRHFPSNPIGEEKPEGERP